MVARAASKKKSKYDYKPDPLRETPPKDFLVILDRYRGRNDAFITVLKEIQMRFG